MESKQDQFGANAAHASDQRQSDLHGDAAHAWLFRPGAGPLAGRAGGPLAGLSFAVKDNIDVAGWPTTAGCAAFAYQPTAHAPVVQQLLDAGALLCGKTNLDQFACGLNGTRSPTGAVANAFKPEYISGGSSSGSAYLVATGEVDFALGTDTAGSGRVPAGMNNIVGLKPTRGLISTGGVVPASRSADCVSIFAPTVDLAARVLDEAISSAPHLAGTRSLPLSARVLGPGFRFGVPSQIDWLGDPLSPQAFEHARSLLSQLGGRPQPINFDALIQAGTMLYESAIVAERYAAIRDFFDANEDQVIEPVRTILRSGKAYSAADLHSAQFELSKLSLLARTLWQQVDCLVVPTVIRPYTIAQMLADPLRLNRQLGIYTNFVNLLDMAAIAVPSSIRADGLPFGITLIGPAGSDLMLARLAQTYHDATGLFQGASRKPLPAPASMVSRHSEPTVQLAVVGAHLSGMPLNGQLLEREARLLAQAFTTPDYRLFALTDSTPPKPGMIRVAKGLGAPIALEIWEMPARHYGSFVALIPAPLGMGVIRLEDGRSVQGFLCEAEALHNARDITEYRGWRAYLASRTS